MPKYKCEFFPYGNGESKVVDVVADREDSAAFAAAGMQAVSSLQTEQCVSANVIVDGQKWGVVLDPSNSLQAIAIVEGGFYEGVECSGCGDWISVLGECVCQAEGPMTLEYTSAPEGTWFNANVLLPEEGVTVLCYAPDFRHDVVMGRLSSTELKHWERPTQAAAALNVTHWMPLPEAPV